MLNFYRIAFLILIASSLSCEEQSSKIKTPISKQINGGTPYFIYDNVEHYYLSIDEEKVWDLEEKEHKSKRQIGQLDILLQNSLDSLSDTAKINTLENIGFIKKVIPQKKFKQLDMVFCNKKHKEGIYLACIAIYRDVIVFKKENKIVGTAKICFSCNQNIISGTSENTEDFGQSGDYEVLYQLLHNN